MLFSIIFRKNIDAVISANMFLCFFYFSSGQFVMHDRENQPNLILDILKRISPFTYITECMMTLFLDGMPEKDQSQLLEFYKMDHGVDECWRALGTIFVVYFVASWLATLRAAR